MRRSSTGTSIDRATHAVVGTEYYTQNDGSVCEASGVLSWHDNELDAWREAKLINQNGGSARVEPYDDASDEDNSRLRDMVGDILF